MADFKSSFMGGYKKKAVDAYIEELENKNKELESKAKINEQKLAKANKIFQESKKIKAEYEKLTDENAKLENETEKLTQIISKLELRLEKSTKQNDDHIANIGKIFYSAYESGSEIAQKAKSGTAEFLNEIGKSSDNARNEIEKAINTCSLINTDIKALLENISKNIAAVSDNTDMLIEKANGVALSMKKIDELKSENERNAEDVLKKYDEFFKEYESEKTSEAKIESDYQISRETAVKNPIEETVEEVIEEPILQQSAEIKNEAEEVENDEVFEEVAPVADNRVIHTPKSAKPSPAPVQRQAVQRQPQAQQRRAVDIIRQQIGTQRPAAAKENVQPKKAEESTPMSQDRAVMLREVLKKFQNSENDE